MWKQHTFKKIKLDSAIVDEIIQLLSYTHVNGGVILSCFQVNNNDVFDSLPMIDNEFTGYFENLLSSYDIVSALPQLRIVAPFHKDVVFNRGNPFTFDGEIASRLCFGGAYRSFEGSPREAKKIASELGNIIFEDRYKESFVFTSNSAWSDWFFNIAWKSTWIIFDEHKSRLWLICLTDTD